MELRLRGRHIGDKRVRVPTTDRSGERLKILAIVASKFACRVAARDMPFLSFLFNRGMQKILIMVYLRPDPELKNRPQCEAIAQFSIAYTERWINNTGKLRTWTH